MASYELHLIYETSEKSRAAKLRKAVREHLPKPMSAFGTLPMKFSNNRHPPPNASDDSVMRLVVFMASGKKPDKKQSDLVDEWIKAGTHVVPLFSESDSFSKCVPKPLSKVNAIKWSRTESTPKARIATDILAMIGLTEQDRKIFISYKRSDSQKIADQLHKQLTELNYSVFLDWVSIDAGKDFQKSLMQDLGEKAMVVLLESENLKDSEWVMAEVDFARRHKLGLLALTWPRVTKNRDLRVKSLPDGYRHRLASIKSKLTETQLTEVVEKIESVHAKAMTRRRKELLGSLWYEAQAHGISVRWIDPWAIMVETGKSKRNVVCTVCPRPANPRDLFGSDKTRESTSADMSLVVYYGHEFLDDHEPFLDWVATGNDVVPIVDGTATNWIHAMKTL